MTATPSASETLKLIGEIHRAFARRVDAPLRDMGFAMAQLPVLFTLNRQQPLSQAELARLIRVEQSTMAQLLNRMERDGLVERMPDPADRRSRLISLTAPAAARLATCKKVLDATCTAALSDFTPEQRAQLRDLLSRIRSNLDTVDGGDSNTPD